MHPENPDIFFEFREKQKTETLNGSVSFIPQYYFSLTSTEGTDHWEMIKLFTLPLYFFFFSQSARTSEAIVCLLSSHGFQISVFQMDPRWFFRNSWDLPTISPHCFPQELGFRGVHSWVHNKCVFSSDFPSSRAWLFTIWIIVLLFQWLQNPFQHLMPPKSCHIASGIRLPTLNKKKSE